MTTVLEHFAGDGARVELWPWICHSSQVGGYSVIPRTKTRTYEWGCASMSEARRRYETEVRKLK